MNTQKPEKKLPYDGTLDVHSVFATIQGEGPYAGCPAVFVRLAGCNLQCPGCDTDYTSSRKKHAIEDLCRAVHVLRGPARLVVITGGEPLRQDLQEFVDLLDSKNNLEIQIETNGTLGQDWGAAVPCIVCSPKTPKLNDDLRKYITAYKYVLQADQVDPSDGLPMSVLENGLRPARPPRDWVDQGIEVYVQPMDERDPSANKRNMQAAIESSMRHGYRLCLQMHKYANLP